MGWFLVQSFEDQVSVYPWAHLFQNWFWLLLLHRQQALSYTHRLCESRLWKGRSRDGFSLLRDMCEAVDRKTQMLAGTGCLGSETVRRAIHSWVWCLGLLTGVPTEVSLCGLASSQHGGPRVVGFLTGVTQSSKYQCSNAQGKTSLCFLTETCKSGSIISDAFY